MVTVGNRRFLLCKILDRQQVTSADTVQFMHSRGKIACWNMNQYSRREHHVEIAILEWQIEDMPFQKGCFGCRSSGQLQGMFIWFNADDFAPSYDLCQGNQIVTSVTPDFKHPVYG